MLDILQQDDYKIIHLTDGELLSEAVKLIDKGKADGINLNYIRNWRTDLEPLRNSKTIKCLAVNDYPPSMQYDYSAVQTLTNLQHLSINTTDKKEIDFSAFPFLTSVALTWRPKAKSLFSCVQLQRLFLYRYTGQDLTELSSLKNLKFLRVNLGLVISLRGLKEITTLEELMLMQTTKLEDIEDLLTLKHLKRLRIDNCKRVRNIRAVKRMNIPKLEIVGTTPDD
ncbi:leucine-rich repeat domain-containing protein [Flavisolibacter ginsengisoli]|jgi:Leucine-rich repeat (LRR) protein|uniref:Leucine Rich repeat-containing protein n=1 Tax=Flavisolibacter ginsengisoli DSM 18119 TaxID=1121884 RepID=A0A1M5DQI6_9BACT|nr:hypothetical protein [Flavisolibacter ginsengisoli]SHF69230.1 hypothetical protein SAMN02745131_03293 [Flavisolibacter ginsengisoli DSM 18119]